MNKVISATEARKNFFKMLKVAAVPGSSITITLEGQPPVIVMSQDEFEGWQETLEIMSDPELMKDIREAEKQKKTYKWEDVKRSMKKR